MAVSLKDVLKKWRAPSIMSDPKIPQEAVQNPEVSSSGPGEGSDRVLRIP